VGFAVWWDRQLGVVWAAGTHEYRPMGTAAIADTDQFRVRDFRLRQVRPAHLQRSFAGFFGSLEEVNAALRTRKSMRTRATPAHLL
jgi:hypothetical protein